MSPEEFQKQLMELVNAKDLSVRDVAHACGVPVPTVERWRSGQNVPHEAMRPAVIALLAGAYDGFQLRFLQILIRGSQWR